MALGQMLGAMGGLAGEKPEVPDYEPIDLQTVLRDTIGANLGNFGDIKELTQRVNRLNANQDMATLEKLFPGAGRIIGQASEFIQSQLSGEIPEDVQRQIETYGAEAATAGGYGGSLFSGAKTAKDLGLTSLQIMNQGLQSAERWLNQSRARVPLFRPEVMFATPGMGWQNAQFNTSNQWNRDWMANQIDAMPEPWEQYAMQSLQQLDAAAWSAATYGMGGMMGGGGGGAQEWPGAGSGSGSFGTPFDNNMNARGASILGG